MYLQSYKISKKSRVSKKTPWDSIRNIGGITGFLLFAFSLILFSLTFNSCSEDKFEISEDPNSGNSELSGDVLTFCINAGSGFATRYATQSDVEDNENKVSNIRILFFEAGTKREVNGKEIENYYYLFEAPPASNLIPQIDENGNDIYKVNIQIDKITDGNGNSIASQIREQFKKAPFKVVMLVNWTSNPSDWTYANSYLNSQAKTEDLKTIHDLHYIKKDDNASTRYGFLTKDGKAGEYEDWVQTRSSTFEYNVSGVNPTEDTGSEKDAADWIRKYWSPMHDYYYQNGWTDKPVYRKYTNLWKLWNFGGSFGNTALSYTDLGASAWEEGWKSRNGDEFAKSDDWFGNNSFWFNNKDIYEKDGLSVIQNIKHTVDGSNDVESTYMRIHKNTTDGYYGIILPKADGIDKNKGSEYLYYGDDKPGYGSLKFVQQSSGHLRIKYSSLNGNSTTIRVQRSSNTVMEFTTSEKTPQDISYTDSKGTTFTNLEIKITGDEEPIFIYNASENPVIIYAIEFISDIYLYETNREGKKPTSSGITMYGVQEYEKFSSWSNGETKDLSSNPISLIRSVAKVEVYLPKKASQIFLRCLNRTARLEPSDVATNTSETWTKNHKGETGEGDCEWYRIQKYTPWYGNGKTTATEYQSWMKWFYGTWGERLGWKDVPSESENGEYPHIFNPRINRSDFCEFIYAGEKNGAHKYVLYVPEKGVDDPNTWNSYNSTPKVIHIEYRYDDYTNNLDDNKCYRIYFTNYSNDSSLGPHNDKIGSVKKDEYENYEKNYENLKLHWPILRNHIYRFNVKENDGSNVTQVIDVKVKPWDYNPATDWDEYW